ncbi:hypothetical protein Bbelb_070610 [Branchiostoma belcheri]|nr:hypothetical protein Bbelb_070610 [Branchiostoma belcheri]
MGASATSLKILDSIQKKALRIIGVNEHDARTELSIPSLLHRRQVAAVSLIYKMHMSTCPPDLKKMLPQPYTSDAQLAAVSPPENMPSPCQSLELTPPAELSYTLQYTPGTVSQPTWSV